MSLLLSHTLPHSPNTLPSIFGRVIQRYIYIWEYYSPRDIYVYRRESINCPSLGFLGSKPKSSQEHSPKAFTLPRHTHRWPSPFRAVNSPVLLMQQIRRTAMTGTDQAMAGVGTPMPRHRHCMPVCSTEEQIQSLPRIIPFNATQRVWCARWYALSVGYQSARHGQSHGLSGYTRRGDGTSNNACPKGRGAGGEVEVRPEGVNRMAVTVFNGNPRIGPLFFFGWQVLRPQKPQKGINRPRPSVRRPSPTIARPVPSYGHTGATIANRGASDAG